MLFLDTTINFKRFNDELILIIIAKEKKNKIEWPIEQNTFRVQLSALHIVGNQ